MRNKFREKKNIRPLGCFPMPNFPPTPNYVRPPAHRPSPYEELIQSIDRLTRAVEDLTSALEKQENKEPTE